MTITLLRDSYQPTPIAISPIGTVDEVLDTALFPSPDDIAQFLLDKAIPAAYTQRLGQSPPRYTVEQAQHYLTVIAKQLGKHNTRDLEWWTIPTWTRRVSRTVIGIVLGTVISLLLVWPVGGLATGPDTGILGGYLRAELSNERPTTLFSIRPRKFPWRRGIIFGLTAMFAATLTGGISSGVGVGIPVLAIGIPYIWLFESAISSEATDPITLWRGNLLVNLVRGFTFGLACDIALVAVPVIAGETLSWLESRFTGGVADWIIDGVGGGLYAQHIDVLSSALPGWLLRGLTPGIVDTVALMPSAGIALGLMVSTSWGVVISQIHLRLRRGTPLRLMHFLEDARSRHLLRTVGPIYQFRHASLQDRLASQRR